MRGETTIQSRTSEAPPADQSLHTPAEASQFERAWRDVTAGLYQWELWGLLGWEDIRQRYRRSLLGPLWLTISMGAMIGGMGLLYSGLLRADVTAYFPFITLGFVVWALINGLVSDGCTVFIQAERIIKQIHMPLSAHVMRVIWRNLIIFFHNILIFIVVSIIFALSPTWHSVLALAGLALICVTGAWVGLLLGLVSARFRDVPPIIASVMQAAFFMTPIIWSPEHLPARAWVVELNPFYYFVEVVRAPLLGQIPDSKIWIVACAISIVGLLTTTFMYSRYRQRVPFWL